MILLKNTMIFLFCFCLTAQLFAQPLNQSFTDQDEKTYLIGKCDRNGLTAEPFNEWFNKGYEDYDADTSVLKRCEGKLADIRFEVFMATWCGDSKREVPRFYKMLDKLGVDEQQIDLINVHRGGDLYKKSPTGEEKGKLIHRVPTFIVYRNDQEIGRIVESPVTSLETDLTQILYDLPSAPNYKIVPQLHTIFEAEGIPEDWNGLIKIARKVYKSSHHDRELNTYGYVLMAQNEMEEALAVFKINAMLYKDEPNVYDSLGEALSKVEKYEEALSMYQRVLQLDPENEQAKEQVGILAEKIAKG